MRLAKFVRPFMVLGVGLSVAAHVNAADSVPSQPQPQEQGSVSFISGGVGEDDAQRLKQMRSQYPLELLFVTSGNPNQYLSDVKVKIMDGRGKVVLDTVSNGPFLLAKVPPGRYSVNADNDGSVKRQSVQVGGGKTQRVMFVWPRVQEQPAK